jgi:hypothetical protein
MNNKKIYVSHQFRYYKEFDLLVNKFKELNWDFCSYVIPEYDPYDIKHKKEIELELKELIEFCNIFLILAHNTIGNSFWLVKEIEYNVKNNHYTIGIIPNEYTKKNSPFYRENSKSKFCEF